MFNEMLIIFIEKISFIPGLPALRMEARRQFWNPARGLPWCGEPVATTSRSVRMQNQPGGSKPGRHLRAGVG